MLSFHEYLNYASSQLHELREDGFKFINIWLLFLCYFLHKAYRALHLHPKFKKKTPFLIDQGSISWGCMYGAIELGSFKQKYKVPLVTYKPHRQMQWSTTKQFSQTPKTTSKPLWGKANVIYRVYKVQVTRAIYMWCIDRLPSL